MTVYVYTYLKIKNCGICPDYIKCNQELENSLL